MDAEQCDAITGERLSAAQSFQFAIEITGHVEIAGFMAAAVEIPEPPPGVCSETDTTVLSAGAAGIELGSFL